MFKNILFWIISLIPITNNTPYYQEEYIIDQNTTPTYIYWIDNNNILVSDYNQSYKYNLLNREKEILSNNLVGYHNNSYYICKYQNVDINTLDEHSTYIQLYDIDNNLIYETSLFPTVRPIICTDEYIIVKNSYSFLEERIYKIHIKENRYEEIKIEKQNNLYNGIQHYKQSKISKDKNNLIMLDIYNRLIYYKNTTSQ